MLDLARASDLCKGIQTHYEGVHGSKAFSKFWSEVGQPYSIPVYRLQKVNFEMKDLGWDEWVSTGN